MKKIKSWETFGFPVIHPKYLKALVYLNNTGGVASGDFMNSTFGLDSNKDTVNIKDIIKLTEDCVKDNITLSYGYSSKYGKDVVILHKEDDDLDLSEYHKSVYGRAVHDPRKEIAWCILDDYEYSWIIRKVFSVLHPDLANFYDYNDEKYKELHSRATNGLSINKYVESVLLWYVFINDIPCSVKSNYIDLRYTLEHALERLINE